MDVSIEKKLLFTYFFLIVVPLVSFTFYAFIRITGVIQEQTFSAAKKTFEDSYNSIKEQMNKLDSIIDILSHDSLVYQMSSNDPRDYSLIQQLEDTQQLTATFSHLKEMSAVGNIRLYVKNDFLYSEQNRDIFPLTSVTDASWYSELSESGGSRHWFAPDELKEDVFSTMRILYNPIFILEPLAVLRVDATKAQLAELMEATPVTANAGLFLMDDSSLFLSSGKFPENGAAFFRQLEDGPQDAWNRCSIDGMDSYILYRSLPSSGWKLAALIPSKDILSVSRELRTEMLFVVLLVSVLAYGLAYFSSKSTLGRLSLLSSTMKAVEGGNVAARVTPSGHDEIGQLMESFNHMVTRIDSLMDEKVAYGQEIKNLELKALQAQINPHFLYNSLDLINCTAINSDVPEISKMVNALAGFYKLSLSNGSESIPLSDELRHAQLYVRIQNMRFEEKIKVIWDIDDSILSCLVIKIILQPLIENAVIHGLFEKPEKSGQILVCACRLNNNIQITVSDDGVGMDSQTLQENFTYTPSSSSGSAKGGYGVRNINERLHLAYGEGYGLSCISLPEKGTTVTILIPAIAG